MQIYAHFLFLQVFFQKKSKKFFLTFSLDKKTVSLCSKLQTELESYVIQFQQVEHHSWLDFLLYFSLSLLFNRRTYHELLGLWRIYRYRRQS